MKPQKVDAKLWQRLVDRAEQDGCSADELLARLLDREPEHEAAHVHRLIAENHLDATVLYTPDGRFVYVSPSNADLIGYTVDEFMAMSVPEMLQDMVHPDDRERVLNIYKNQVLQGQPGDSTECRFRHKDGSYIWIENRNTPLLNDQGDIEYILSTTRDITEHKQTEERLKAQERPLAISLKSAQAGVWVWDIGANHIIWDDALHAMYGLEPGAFDGTYEAWKAGVHPDDLEAANAAVEATLAGGDPFNAEFRVMWPDGTIRYMLGQAVVVRDEAGEPAQMIGVNIDITERKRAEENLRASEEQYRRLFESLPIPVFTKDRDGVYTSCNAENLKYWSVNPVGHTDAELLDAATAARLREIDQQVMQTGETLTIEESLKGTPLGDRLAFSRKMPLYDQDGEVIGVLGASIDITERKQAEEDLRDSEEKYRLIAQNTSDGIIIVDGKSGEVTYASPAYDRHWGRQPGDSEGIDTDDMYEVIHPEDRDGIFKQIYAAIDQQADNLTYSYRIRHGDGTYRWREDHAKFHYDADGKLLNTYVIARDITECKQHEAARLDNERLKARFSKEQEHNALIQRIISTLSHDLRTPLSVIATSKDFLSRYYDRLTPEKRQEKLDSIDRQIQFALKLLEDTVQMARGNLDQRKPQLTPVNLALLCQVSLDESREADKDKHIFTFNNQGKLETVMVDEILVSRILLNLLSNARKYSPAGSQITLELDRHEGRVVLRVIDEGMGIDADDLPYIFEPFFRAGNVNHVNGSGLGLSIVKDCVVRHNGYIITRSRLNEGTTFIVELPTKPQDESSPVA